MAADLSFTARGWVAYAVCLPLPPPCCRYDFFHDQVPHTDRHARLVEGKWQPVTGP